MTLLVQDVDRGLEDIQQTCQYAGESAGGICFRHLGLARSVDSGIALQRSSHAAPGHDLCGAGDFVESKLEKLRRLLHERQAQGLPSAAGEVSALRAELSRLTERLSSEMAVSNLLR